MSARSHPYIGKPDHQFWKSVSAPGELDPVVHPSFRIADHDRVVTAGSCFAQHVARHLTLSGMRHHVTEPGHGMFSPALLNQQNYGTFSARYGNIYTARQLHQLLLRAYGSFSPLESVWSGAGGTVVDPFRPQIQPGGFVSERELLADRQQHFAAVRRAIESMDAFVFTLGLTEAWIDRRDGAVFPLAPGVAGGHYDDKIHAFQNFSAAEVTEDMNRAIAFIRERNPKVRILITVSPVPLNATALDRHVVVSTAYSKAVLRVAAEQICAAWENADYFPSYEIITAPSVRGRYFGADSRSVLEEGVEHVMRVFFRHYRDQASIGTAPPAPEEEDAEARYAKEVGEIVRVLCDEEAITNS